MEINAGRSREWSCPVCKVRNIELLPDREANAVETSSENKGTPTVQLSFGYQKDQSSGQTTPSNTGI
jgi:hypothetical protein